MSKSGLRSERMSAKAAFPPLVCPFDLAALAESADGFACSRGHRFPNSLGIPRLVESQSNYADAFGEQWKRFRSTQLDSYSRTTISRDRLQRCLGEDLWRKLQAPGPVQVLEAGCGAGRFTEILLELPATVLTSTDLSSAVEPNQVNFPQSERHRIIQCDIGKAPFAPGQFDIVVCLGVIQHTRSPEQTIAALYDQVKPGGWLVVDHYTHSFARHTKLPMLLLRPLLKRVRPQTSLDVTRRMTDIFFPIHRLVRKHRVLQALLSRISPLSTYFHVLPQLDDRLQYEWAFLDAHDGLTDYYKHLRSGGQIRRTLGDLGAQEIHVVRAGNGIEARAVRPGQRT